MKYDEKDILKKLFDNNLSDEEYQQLLDSPSVREYMEHQWAKGAQVEGADMSDIDADLLWKKVRERTIDVQTKRICRFPLQRTLVAAVQIAACVMLLVGLKMLFSPSTQSLDNIPQVAQTIFIDEATITSRMKEIRDAVLPDGTAIVLGSGTTVYYREDVTNNTREVFLDGQAFFDVQKDETRPFIVRTSHMNVQAVGTAFEVFAFSDMEDVETVLVEGCVKVTGAKAGEEVSVLMEPDQKLSFNTLQGEMKLSQVDARRYTSWMNSTTLSFDNESLGVIIPRLERWYGCSIECAEDVGEQYKFTFKVRSEPIEKILTHITEVSTLKLITQDDNHFALEME